MARGGKRAGSGRPPGAHNKRSREIAEKAAKKGITPLEYMLKVMRSKSTSVTDERRDEMAKAAAPYMHPRLNAIQHTGKDGEPIQVSFTNADEGAL